MTLYLIISNVFCDQMKFHNIKNVLLEDIFHLVTSAANEFCEWGRSGINVFNSYQWSGPIYVQCYQLLVLLILLD